MEEESERWVSVVSLLKEVKPPEVTLIYCATRGEADDLSRWLQSAGFPACSYHAGLSGPLRKARSLAFRKGLLPIVCASSAFGMGIDYPKVKQVIHFSMPYGIEAYWQEAGRAGRDGGPATAFLFWRRSEIARARRMKPEERERFSSLWMALAKGGCRKQAIARHFGHPEEPCGNCDQCLQADERLWSWKGGAWWLEPEARLLDWVFEKLSSEFEKS
jgi:ATP-dependent DNA helicase RecQ